MSSVIAASRQPLLPPNRPNEIMASTSLPTAFAQKRVAENIGKRATAEFSLCE